MRKRIYLALFMLISAFIMGCDPNRVIEENTSFDGNKWYYNSKPVYYADIKDTTSNYNIYFKVRHTGNYKYSNLFVLCTIQSPGKDPEVQRYEFKLAEQDGRWLGEGLGDIYSNSILIEKDIKFPKTGVYSFSFEQNMREDPLSEIEDIGIRVEKVIN